MLSTLLVNLAAGSACAQERFEVGLWVDHQDYATPSGGRTWDTVSPEGLEEIVDYCIEAGATSLYWRGFGGGLTVHNSAVEEGLYPQLVDILKNVWGCRRVVVDATGVGEGVASFLSKALGSSVVVAFHFSQDIRGSG